MKRALLLVLSSFVPAGAQVLSVCEALERREQINGKMVAIRGPVEGGEGAWMIGVDCKFSQGSDIRHWPSMISLAHPKGNTALSPVDFTADAKALHALEIFVRRKPRDQSLRLYVTYYGRFETYRALSDRRKLLSDGRIITLGFGHLGAAPAQLIVQTALEPRYLFTVSDPSANRLA